MNNEGLKQQTEKKPWSAPKVTCLGTVADVTQKHSNDGEGGGKLNNS